MWGNGKIFVSHAHDDNARCEPLLAALDAWGLDYWFDTQQLDAGAQLTERLQRAIAERDVFLRICTGATRASYWMTLEFNAFRGLQLEEQKRRGSGTNRRVSINLILDGAYKAAAAPGDSQTERADALVDAMASPPAVWLAQLRAALGIAPQRARQGISRRAAIGLGAAAVVTAAATGTTIVLKSQSGPTVTHVPKPKKVPFAVPNAQTLDPRLLWYFKAGDSTAPAPAVALGPRALYLNSNDGFYALNPSDGSIIWSNPAITGDGNEVPVLIGDTIYTLGGLGKLTALSATNGNGLWTVDTKNLLADVGIVSAGGSIVVPAEDGTLIAYNTSDGSTRWQSPSLGKTGLSSPSPIVSGGIVLIGSGSGVFYALSASDGTIKWQYQTGGEISATAAASSDTVYFGSKDAKFYAVDIASGTLKWRLTASSEVSNAPALSQGVIYVGIGNFLHALEASTGKELWKVPVGDVDASGNVTSIDYVSAAAAVGGDGIYVPSGTYLYAFSARTAPHYTPTSGQPAYAWRFNVPKSFSNSWAPVVGTSTVFFPADDGAIYALKTS